MDKLTKNSKLISISSLERQLLLIDELNGVKVTDTQITPGIEIGQSDFMITLKDEPKYNGYIIADNYGNKYTGRYRINAIGFVNSLNKTGTTFDVPVLIT